jgi:hypothetical protein
MIIALRYFFAFGMDPALCMFDWPKIIILINV